MFDKFFWDGIFFFGIFKLLFIVLIIWLVVKLINRDHAPRHIPPLQENALDILKKRYAKGEITKEQFDQMRSDLQL